MSRFLTFIAHYIIVSIILVSLAFSPLAYIQTAHSETRKGNIERLALTKHTTSGIYYVSIPINFNADQEKSYEIYTALSDYLVANNLAYILEVQGPDAMTGSPKLSSSQEFGNLFKAYENSIPSNYSHPDYSPFYTLPDIPNKSVVSPMSVTPALSVIPSEQSVPVWAGNLIFRIINTSGGIMNWTASVTSGFSWLSIADVTAGVNNGTMNEKTIMVRFLQNNGPSPRTAEITVIAPGATGNPKVVTITQAGSAIIPSVPNIPEERATEQERIRRLEAERQQQKDQRKIDEQIRAQEAAKEALNKAKNDEEQRTAEEARKKVEEARVTAEQEAQKHQQEEALRKAQEEQKQAEEQHKAQTAAEEAKRKEQQNDNSQSTNFQTLKPTLKPSVSVSQSDPIISAITLTASVFIFWQSENATYCMIDGIQVQTSGSVEKRLSGSTSYTISCVGNGGKTTKSITVIEPTTGHASDVLDYLLLEEKFAISLIKPVASTVWKMSSTLTKTGTVTAVKGVIRELATGVQKFFGGIGEKIGKVFFKNMDEAATVVSKVAVSNVANLADEVVEFTEDVWLKSWSKRGKIIDLGLGNNLGPTFKGVDILENRTVVSIKSMDINAPTYKTASNIRSKLKQYVNGVRDFAGYKRIEYGKNFENRALKLAIPDTALTQEQISVIKEVKDYAKSLDIGFTITVVK